MKAYLDLLNKVLKEGVWVHNTRTNSNCLTIANHTMTYDVGNEEFPLVTTRKAFWKQAIGEMLCYIRGYDDLRDFHALGVNTWDANAKAWGKGKDENDVGLIYGASAKKVGIDYHYILDKLKNTPDDRGIIWNFWNPEYFDQGCLRPCMYSHQFTVLNDTLYLTSVQRSNDLALGTVFNMVQCYFLLALTAHLTGYKAGTVTHHLINCHIYENQMDGILEQVKREPFDLPKLIGIENFNLENTFKGREAFDQLKVEGYQHHPAIKYPFTA